MVFLLVLRARGDGRNRQLGFPVLPCHGVMGNERSPDMADYDVAIIGGGLNGVSIARDAAGRGLRVLLLEQDDLGGAASSASSRLIHGDLSALEPRGLFPLRPPLPDPAPSLPLAPPPLP